MKVALVNLTSGGLSGGYAKYLRHLLPLLRSDARISQLKVVMPPNDPWLKLNNDDALHWSPEDRFFGFRRLRADLRRLNPDVLFIPTARWLDCSIPTVVMVRNMEPLTIPFNGNPVREGLKNCVRRWVARQACFKSKRVIAVSEHVRRYLTERWKVDPEKVSLIYHGVEFLHGETDCVKPVRLTHGLPSRFIFAAGSIRPARGLEDVIGATALLSSKYTDLGLVIAGSADPGTVAYQKQLHRLARARGIADKVLWVGRLDVSEMSWCFQNCSAFVMTSRAEACPNIALEAMNYDCRIVSSSQEPMPEFFAECALYYAPGNVRDLAKHIQMVLDGLWTPEVRPRTHVGAYNWHETARKTVDELLRAAQGQ